MITARLQIFKPLSATFFQLDNSLSCTFRLCLGSSNWLAGWLAAWQTVGFSRYLAIKTCRSIAHAYKRVLVLSCEGIVLKVDSAMVITKIHQFFIFHIFISLPKKYINK